MLKIMIKINKKKDKAGFRLSKLLLIIILKGTLSREECFLSSWEKPIAVVSDAIFFLDLLSCIMLIDCENVKSFFTYITSSF